MADYKIFQRQNRYLSDKTFRENVISGKTTDVSTTVKIACYLYGKEE